jgi:hypothetical protein
VKSRLLGRSGLLAPSGMCSDGTTTGAQKLANLETLLRACFGADLIGLWIGEDLAYDGSNNVTSWPHRVGGAMTHSGADYATTAVSGGRRGMTFSAINKNSLYDVDLGTVVKSMWAVAESPALPTASYQSLAKALLDNEDPLVLNSGTSDFLTATGWSHLVDGAATDTITPGRHVLEGRKAAPGPTATRSMKGYTANYQWFAMDYFRMALSALPTTAQRANGVAILRSYYSI